MLCCASGSRTDTHDSVVVCALVTVGCRRIGCRSILVLLMELLVQLDVPRARPPTTVLNVSVPTTKLVVEY